MTKSTDTPKTIRLHVFVPAVMMDRLKAISKETGAPVSELVRRAMAAYLLSIK